MEVGSICKDVQVDGEAESSFNYIKYSNFLGHKNVKCCFFKGIYQNMHFNYSQNESVALTDVLNEKSCFPPCSHTGLEQAENHYTT